MAPAKLGVDELRTFILACNIPAEIVNLDVPTPTVQTAANAVGAHADQIIKSILFLANEHPILAIACGLANIQRRAIADLYSISKKKVKLASPEMVLEISGYEVGAMPPFGHRQPLPTVIDQRVLTFTDAYAGGGADNVLLRLNPQDILRVTGAKLLDLLE